MSTGNFIICVVFSLWTFIQTSLHLVFIVYAFYMSTCAISPTQDTTIFFYLTYLYDKNCDVPELQEAVPTPLEFVDTYIFNLVSSETSTSDDGLTMAEVVRELLDKLEYFPDYALASSRTSVLLLSFLILDGAWLVTAVALLMGTCFGVKQTLSLIYYGPWLVVTVCMCIFDAAAAILFGLDMAETINFSNWMKFVGILDTTEFEDLNPRNLSTFIPVTPSLAISSISARFILIWISNWIGFFYVMRATLSIYKERETKDGRRRPRPHPSPDRDQMDLDTSAARIRNWQLFYGAIETTNTSSLSNSSGLEEDRDLNSNSKEGRGVHVEFQNERVPSISENVSTYYHAYSDVADVIEGAAGLCLDELRGQLPWSYIAEDQRGIAGDEGVELEHRGRRVFRLKSDSSVGGTECEL